MPPRTRTPSAPAPTAPAAADVVVLTTKLAPPRLEGRRVARPRLLERLDRLSALPLTVVSAPPGFGKTTLLRQWRAARPPGTTAWLSIDAGDDHPDRLWAHVCAALGATPPPPRDAAAPPAAAGELVAHALRGSDARGGARALVVDDYHHVTDPACHERMRSLVEHLPATLRLVIATRRDPPLPLSRMRAGGALGELRAGDLRMEPEEARLLIEEPGVSLRARDVRRLYEKTAGWPAGLYLAALSLRGRDDGGALVEAFSGSHRHVVEYMASEVLAGEDERTRDFLLRTSVLDRMSGPLCDVVLATSGSAATLRALEERNLLVTALDDERRWFRYHPLFRDVLRFMLAEALPSEVDGLHGRASAWWEEHGDAGLAGEHALAARDARRAARIVGAHWRETAGARGAAPAIDPWLERLPRAVVLADPGLCLARAVLEEARGAPRAVVEGWLEAADRDPGGGGAGGSAPSSRMDSVLLEAVRVRAAGGGQDVARRLGDAARAHRLAASSGPAVRALAETHLAYAQWQAGRHADALATARAALARSAARTAPLMLAVQQAVASLAMAALGDHAGADEEARAAFGRMRSHGDDRAPRATIVWLAHGTACARRGAADEAVGALRTAADLAEGPELALDRAHALLALARALKARGEVAGAAAAVREARRIAGAAADPGTLRALIAAADPPPGAGRITAAEMRILRLLPGPLTLRQVGERLYLSLNTVKSHTRVLYRKLEADSREEAVARAIEAGLLPRPEAS